MPVPRFTSGPWSVASVASPVCERTKIHEGLGFDRPAVRDSALGSGSAGGGEAELQKAALVSQVGHGIEDQSVDRGEGAELVDPAFATAEDH